MTDSKLELVARAICRVEMNRDLYSWDENTEELAPTHKEWQVHQYESLDAAVNDDWEYYVKDARAALDALEEPTEGMLEALRLEDISFGSDEERRASEPGLWAKSVWAAGIRAAKGD